MFNSFMDMENRELVDDLYSSCPEKVQKALITLKNGVIGNNREKGSVISQGIVIKLKSLLIEPDTLLQIRLDAAIVIGSLAKGSEMHVRSLVDMGIVQLMLALIVERDSDKRLIDICLCVMRTIFQYSFAPTDLIRNDICTIRRLIGFASPSNTIENQICIACILTTVCQTYHEQMIIYQAGGVPILARLIASQYPDLQISALRWLAGFCFTNRHTSEVVCQAIYDNKYVPEILTTLLSRARPIEVQLTSARCLTYLFRSGALEPTDPRIVYKTLPCLARLCTPEFDERVRATSAETLAYLAEIDSELQRLASISNHLINSLTSLLRCSSPLSRQGSFRCFASLGANDEEIRKKIIEMDGLMDEVLRGLTDPCPEVSLAAVRCLHSLSRSVQQLRTTFQDHSVWRPLMDLLSVSQSNELLTVVTSTICNLLLEFSPSKEPMVESGAVEMLCQLTRNEDPALRLNGVWALMNMAFKAEDHINTKIINTLGTDNMFTLLSDPDTRVIMKTLGLLRNLLSKTPDIERIMSEHQFEINHVLDSSHSSEVKEQILCIVANIAHAQTVIDYIVENDKIFNKLLEFLNQKDSKLQDGAILVISRLVEKYEKMNVTQPLAKLRDMGVVEKLETFLNNNSSRESNDDVRTIIRKLVTYTS